MQKTALMALGFLLALACSRGPSGPTAADKYDEYRAELTKGKDFEKAGDRLKAIHAYRQAKVALEDMKAYFPDSDYFDPTDLAHVKDIITRLEDEERRGVDPEPDTGPPPVEEPELTGELYHGLRGAIEAKIGKETNTQPPFERAKHIEPRVIDNTPALEIWIKANEYLIQERCVQECKKDLKEVMKILLAFSDELRPYPLIVVAGQQLVPDAEGFATQSLLVEYRFDQEALRKLDTAKLDDEDFDLREAAIKTTEP